MTTINERCCGTVEFYNKFNGRGMIVMPDGREVRVRYSAVQGEGIRNLEKGAVVSFQLEETPRGLYAVCVQQEAGSL